MKVKIFRIYISQPMDDREEEERAEERNRIFKNVKKFLDKLWQGLAEQPYGFILMKSPYDGFSEDVYEESPEITCMSHPVKCVSLFYIGRALQCISAADIVVLPENWLDLKNGIIEHTAAGLYEIPILCASPDGSRVYMT